MSWEDELRNLETIVDYPEVELVAADYFDKKEERVNVAELIVDTTALWEMHNHDVAFRKRLQENGFLMSIYYRAIDGRYKDKDQEFFKTELGAATVYAMRTIEDAITNSISLALRQFQVITQLGNNIDNPAEALRVARIQFKKIYDFAITYWPAGKIPKVCKSADFQIHKWEENVPYWWKACQDDLNKYYQFEWVTWEFLDLRLKHQDNDEGEEQELGAAANK